MGLDPFEDSVESTIDDVMVLAPSSFPEVEKE